MNHHDGYVRLTLDEILTVPFAHLISGLDEVDEVTRCGTATTLTGYTEWIGRAAPAVTVGWDWIIEAHGGRAWWRRLGPPRTNVLLVDRASQDYDWDRSLTLLGTVVDALPWQEQARCAVVGRAA